MTARCEQRVLDWLVRRNSAHEPLCGDLIEELERGRSRRWFWRQFLYAWAASAGRHAWTSKRAIAEDLALRLAITGVLLFASYVTWTLAAIVAGAVTVHMLS